MNQRHAQQVIDQIMEQHRKKLEVTLKTILAGIPREGGLYSRSQLRLMLKTAFIGGLVVATEAKLKQGTN